LERRLSGIILEIVVRILSGLVFVGEFLFLAYPLVRKHLGNVGFFPQLLYSHIISASTMIGVLWLAYSFSRDIVSLFVISALLVSVAVLGTALFASDLIKRKRRPSRDEWCFILLISFAVVLAISSALSLPFLVQGDAYEYYVPIGRYLNQHPGAYLDSYYRFSLSRNFGYFALYANADLLGGSFGSYLLLPIPFLLGTIFGVISLSKKITSQNTVALIAATCYIFSVYFGLLLKYNMFYLGNLLMATIALLYSYFLLVGAKSVLEKLAIAFSTFAMLLIYDFTLLLLIPLAFGCVACCKPRLVFYVLAALAIPFVLLVSTQSVSLGYAQLPQLDFGSSLAILGLIVLILAGTWRGMVRSIESPKILVPAVLVYGAAGASLLLQRVVNLFNYGFMTLASYPLSSTVLAYTKRNYWFYLTPPDVSTTIVSIFSSDMFLGWGLLFTAYGLFLNRNRPVTTFFLTVLPLIILVETVNNNYLRFAAFLVPLIVVFLASGLHTLIRKDALLVCVTISFLALLEKAATTFPRLDYEHMAIANPFDLAVFGITIFLATMISGIKTRFGIQLASSTLSLRARNLSMRAQQLFTRVRIVKSMGWRGLASVLILVLSVPVFSYNVLAIQYSKELYSSDASIVDPQVLPLIQDKSTVLTVELINTNFNFYKDVVVISMAQPWILESFLRLQIANETALVAWLVSNGIGYVFTDRGLTAVNKDVFGLFDQLSRSCYNYRQCNVRFDDGRFVLLKITM
jgi:hypothetical protein